MSIGLLYAARGVGAAIGPLLAQRWGGESAGFLRRAIGPAFFCTALGYVAFSRTPWLWMGALAVVLAHIGGSIQWVFLNGEVYRFEADQAARGRRTRSALATGSLTAPMPATVVKVLVKPGDRVAKGDTVVVLEAMKMELPLRAAGDATVKAVHCREGELVQPDAVLVEMPQA